MFTRESALNMIKNFYLRNISINKKIFLIFGPIAFFFVMLLFFGLINTFKTTFEFIVLYLTIASAGLLAGLTLFFLVIKDISKRLNAAKDAIDKFDIGNRNLKINIPTGDDELGFLINSFNTMSRRIFEYTVEQEQYAIILNNEVQNIEKKSSELENAYKALKEVQGQLLQSEKMASIGQLAAGIAHEINNPTAFVLTNIKTLESYVANLLDFVDTCEQIMEKCLCQNSQKDHYRNLKQELDLDFIRKDAIALVNESIEGIIRVKNIVADLKNFSRVDNSDFDYADINQGIESTLNIIFNELKYKTKIIKEYGNIPKIKCRPGELNQVFMNLLVNAGQAIVDKGEILIRTHSQDEEVFIEIGDTGCGIPEENLQKIFEPFFTTKPVGKGTGLGLSISYSIIKSHMGELTVRSKVGEGTAFTIRLPVEMKPLEKEAVYSKAKNVEFFFEEENFSKF